MVDLHRQFSDLYPENSYSLFVGNKIGFLIGDEKVDETSNSGTKISFLEMTENGYIIFQNSSNLKLQTKKS